MSEKLIFRSGEYINHYIDDVLEHDPAYIVEQYSVNPDMGITEQQYDTARRLLDEWDGNTDPVDDWFFLEQAGLTGGTYD